MNFQQSKFKKYFEKWGQKKIRSSQVVKYYKLIKMANEEK